MHRRPLLELLDRYCGEFPQEKARVDRFRALVLAQPDCFERHCLPGHITGSAWIVSPDGGRFLLGHHRKLGRWLQLGGHADGEADVLAVAVREAREESGLDRFAPIPTGGSIALDLDIHRIPALRGEPEHEHYDVRFLLRADPGLPLRVSSESHALGWFAASELDARCTEESLRRLGRKARAVLTSRRGDAP